MSYSICPRTKLSCDSSACVVLTEGYVFVSSGLGANQRMPLADWEILINGATIREDFIPIEAEQHVTVTATTEEPLPAPIGTKLVWKINAENYSVAIQTIHGTLQVKKVSEGARHETQRILFETCKAWCDSLPLGGTLSQTRPQDAVSPFQKRRNDSAKLLAADTPDTVLAIQKLWKVRTGVNYHASLNMEITYLENCIGSMRDALRMVALDDDMNDPRRRRKLTRQLEREVVRLHRLKARLAENPSAGDFQDYYLYNCYKQRLWAHTATGKIQIAYDKRTKNIAARMPDGISFRTKLFPSLAAMGVRMRDGKPDLSVRYRCREIDL